MKNMERGIILILSAMVIFLTFCNVVTAHPGHGEPYPEEITNSTTSSNPTSTPSTTNKKKIKNTKKSLVTNEESIQNKNTDSQNTDNQAENQPYEEVNNSDLNFTSPDSGSSLWNILGPVLGLVGGFAAVGLLFKSGLLK